MERMTLLRSRAERIVRALDVPVLLLRDVERAIVRQDGAEGEEDVPLTEKPVIMTPAGRLIANPRWSSVRCESCATCLG